LQNLVASVLESLQRDELPALESLAQLGESEPAAAARALRRAAAVPELSRSRSSWIPALLLSARPGQGARCLYQLAQRSRERLGEVLDLGAMPSLVPILGSSGFLGRTLLEHPAWVRDLRGDPPPPPHDTAPAGSWDAIAEGKYRGLLRVAARELLGCPLQESQAELSNLAERCLSAALDCASRETGVAPPGMVALGELGSREFSVSPDVDLLFLDWERDLEADSERSSGVGRLVKHLLQQLGTERESGILYRVGGGSRSAIDVTATVSSARTVLESLASSREPRDRHDLLRARPIGRVDEAGQAVLAGVKRHLYAPDAPSPKGKASWSSLRTGAIAGPESFWDVREAPGGIRDLELLVFTLVLAHGGARPQVRTGNLVEALFALARSGVLEESCARALIDCGGWLRKAEHFLQLADEESTWEFPRDKQGQCALARCMGYREPDVSEARLRLLGDWHAVRDEVQARCQELFLSGQGESTGR
jgi:glutamate-ammonia-ligase adenylyltransferase